MKTLVPKDLKLTERTYNNLRKHGAIPEFVDYELPNMITYFTETQDKKKSWQMTVQRWMRLAFKGKAGKDWEYNRHNQYNTQYNNFSQTQTTIGTIPTFDLPTDKPMSSKKRIEFADYLSKSMNK